MKKLLFIFVFFLSAIRYPLSAIFAAPPHPLIYDVGPVPPELQALITKPRLAIPVMPAEHVSQRASTTGTAEVVAILIKFADTTPFAINFNSASHSNSYFDHLLFSQNTGYYSMYDYFNEVSDAQLKVTGTTGPQWYQSSKNMSYYGADGYQGIDNLNVDISNLVIEAVQMADDDIDFSLYDTDSDGIVNHVIIIHAGRGQEDTSDTNNIWSHSGSFTTSNDENGYLTHDGVHVQNYTMLSEYSPVGTFVHEFGHDLGLPDLYYTQPIIGNQTMVGDWDLMDGGSWLGPDRIPYHDGSRPAHIGAWGKKFLGWITPIELTKKELGVPVDTTGIRSVYKIPLVTASDPSKEYFLVEYRKKDNFDQYLPGEGLLIWHIDDAMLDYETTDYWGNSGKAIDLNVVNSSDRYVPHRAVDLIEADKTDKTSEASDPFPGSKNITSFLSPDNDAYNLKPSQFSVLNISSAGGSSMTFDIYQAVCTFTKLPDITKIYSYPNPSSTGQTKLKIITTNLVETKNIDLKIYDINGGLIRESKAGEISQVSISDNKVEYEYTWNCRNESGEKVASGIYLYWFKADNKEKVGKVAILK